MAAVSHPDPNLRTRHHLYLSSGQTNFLRIARLLLGGGTILLREVFDTLCTPSNLPRLLSNPFILKDLKEAKLSKLQWSCLCPSPGVYGKSTDFDIRLLVHLLSTTCRLASPAVGWDVLPRSMYHSFSADLERIKHYWDLLLHCLLEDDMEIKSEDFQLLCQEISEVLLRIAGKISHAKRAYWQSALCQLLRDPIIPEDERHVHELLAWYQSENDLGFVLEEAMDSLEVQGMSSKTVDRLSSRDASSKLAAATCTLQVQIICEAITGQNRGTVMTPRELQGVPQDGTVHFTSKQPDAVAVGGVGEGYVDNGVIPSLAEQQQHNTANAHGDSDEPQAMITDCELGEWVENGAVLNAAQGGLVSNSQKLQEQLNVNEPEAMDTTECWRGHGERNGIPSTQTAGAQERDTVKFASSQKLLGPSAHAMDTKRSWGIPSAPSVQGKAPVKAGVATPHKYQFGQELNKPYSNGLQKICVEFDGGLSSAQAANGRSLNMGAAPQKPQRCSSHGEAMDTDGGFEDNVENALCISSALMDVFNFIVSRSFQVTDHSCPEERNGFLEYLEKVNKVLGVEVQPGRVLITLEIKSLQILEKLWYDYHKCHLDEMAQRFLVTEGVLRSFGLTEVKLSTIIAEEEYKACRDYFLKHSGVGHEEVPSGIAGTDDNPGESKIDYGNSEVLKQVQKEAKDSISEGSLTERGPGDGDVEVMSGEPEQSQSGSLTSEGDSSLDFKDDPIWTEKEISSKITSGGGLVVGEGVKLMYPPGAVDNPVSVWITVEDPSKYYGLIVQKDLENDVMFGMPIINLTPNGQAFKKPLTLTTKLIVENFQSDNIVILHGTVDAKDKITWHDITHNSKINEQNAEVSIEFGKFSLVSALLKLTKIRTQDLLARLNLLAFKYTMLMLLNKTNFSSPYDELAVLFVSQDVHHEQFYREHRTSALVKLKSEGFTELHVRSIVGQEEKRIYNNEILTISISLGEDYTLADGKQGVRDFKVHSSVWWNSGEVIKLPLEWTEEVRMLCGQISVQGQFGHTSEKSFNETDVRGYVRGLLGVEGAIFNVVSIAQLFKMPDELVNQVIKSWRDDDGQLEIILQHRSKEKGDDVAELRKGLRKSEQKGLKVTRRGQMHVRNVRELATKIMGLQYSSAEVAVKYFIRKIQTLCKRMLRDCCIEIESTTEGVDTAASSTNHIDYLRIRQAMSTDVAQKFRQLYSSSGESFIKNFLVIVPQAIQNVKEIFVEDRYLEVQNGLKGLTEGLLETYLSFVQIAEEKNLVQELVCTVSEILEKLSLSNCDQQFKAQIERWGRQVAIFPILDFLKPFFQHCKQDVRLHKRIELLTDLIKDIMFKRLDIADEPFMRDLTNVSLSVIHFAKFSATKLVRFEVTDANNSTLTCHSEDVKYDGQLDTFSQRYHIMKVPEGELQLHAIAHAVVDGRVVKVGAFQAVIDLDASSEDTFDRSMAGFGDVAVAKLKGEFLRNVRVFLSSTRKRKLSDVLQVLKQELSGSVVDFRLAEINQCRLTLRTAAPGTALSFRLLYKSGSGAIGLDSKDFEICADSSGGVPSMPDVQRVGFSTSVMACGSQALGAGSSASSYSDQLCTHDSQTLCRETDAVSVEEDNPIHVGEDVTSVKDGNRTHENETSVKHSNPTREDVSSVKQGNPRDEELEELAGKIGRKWRALGRRLDFDESELTGFYKDKTEYRETAYAMLLAWKHRGGSKGATYQILKEALCHHLVGRTDLAENFCCG